MNSFSQVSSSRSCPDASMWACTVHLVFFIGVISSQKPSFLYKLFKILSLLHICTCIVQFIGLVHLINFQYPMLTSECLFLLKTLFFILQLKLSCKIESLCGPDRKGYSGFGNDRNKSPRQNILFPWDIVCSSIEFGLFF